MEHKTKNGQIREGNCNECLLNESLKDFLNYLASLLIFCRQHPALMVQILMLVFLISYRFILRRRAFFEILTPITPTTTRQMEEESVKSVEENEEELRNRYNTRRKSVFAEAYNPEEDDDEGAKPQVYPKSDEQRKTLAENVKNILLFRSMDVDQNREVLDAMFEKTVKAGDYIIRQGDDGDNFYVIENGKYHAYVAIEDGSDKLIHTYDNKGSFGELALMYNMPRAATIKAATDGSLWALDRQTFRRIVLKSAFKKRKMYESLIESVPMLTALESYERMNLADALIPKTYEDGDCIIKQGDVADGMYFVEAGLVRITVFNEKREEVEINQIKNGEYFGELALVTHKPRAASAYASGRVRVAFLDVEAFERLLGPCMEVMKRNFDDYENQLLQIFGSRQNISDVR